MRRALLPGLMMLASCTGGDLPGLEAGQQKVVVEGDVFFVSHTDRSAVARNYATGFYNQARLIEHAGVAVARATGCTVGTIAKRQDVNVYDATLTCPAQS